MTAHDLNRLLIQDLEERFATLFSEVGSNIHPARVVNEYRRVIRRHCMRPRIFHTPHHIASCLREFDEVRAFAQEPNVILMAIFYRSIVCDVERFDNEEQSAKSFAYAAEHSLGLEDAAFVKRVSQMIRSSGRHAHAPADTPDEQLFSDICAAILGRDAPEYDQYASAIRLEHDYMKNSDWAFFRVTSFIDWLLEQDSIYFTEPFRSRYEENARANLMQERVLLQG